MRRILSDAGHEVVGDAQDGLDAPARVHELRPELVTLDLVMPGRSGLTTLRHLLMVDSSLTVVVCSASLNQHNVIEALRLGAKGLIVKPLARKRCSMPSMPRLRTPIATARTRAGGTTTWSLRPEACNMGAADEYRSGPLAAS